MVNGNLGTVLEHIRQLFGTAGGTALTDGQLLDNFVTRHDETAFAALLHRHGPMVLGVCRRILHHAQDVDDAFQATFLVLIRKAGSIARKESVGSWLYGVAYRIAVRARSHMNKRSNRERPITDTAESPPGPSADVRELQTVVDEALHGLPEKYRAPLVLHYLGGKTKSETARQLGWTEGTVSGRLARGRQLLRARLARRGLDVSAGVIAWVLSYNGASGAVPLALLNTTLKVGVQAVTGKLVAGVASVRAAAMADALLRSLLLARLKLGAGLIVVMSFLAAGAALVARQVQPAPAPASRQGAPLSSSARTPDRPDSQPRPARDVLGDPLPLGALARLGTTRGRHAGPLSALAFSRDGKVLATRGRDDRVRLWEAATGKLLHVLPGEVGTAGAGLWCFAFAPDGRTLATGGGDGMVRFWDVRTGRQLRRVRGNHLGVRSLAFTSDGKLLAVAGEDNELSLREPARWTEVRCLRRAAKYTRPVPFESPVKEVAFSPDNKLLEVLRLCIGKFGTGKDNDFDSTLELWEVKTGRKWNQLNVPPFYQAPVFAADSKGLVWVDRGKVCLRAVDNGREIRQFGPTYHQYRALALTADGRTLAVSSGDAVRLWSVATGKSGRKLERSDGMGCLAFSRDGRTLVGARYDGTFQLWDTATGKKRLRPFPGHQGMVARVAYSPDGKTLATCSPGDGTIRLWQAATGRELRHWQAHRAQGASPLGPTLSLAFSPDGKTLASGGGDRTLRLWVAASGKEIRSIPGAAAEGCYVADILFSPDGKFLAAGDNRGGVGLWTVGGKKVRRFQESSPPDAVLVRGSSRALAFSPDGKSLAAANGPVVCLWETASGNEVRRFTVSQGWVSALAFAPDGKTLAAANGEDVVRCWEVATGKERRQLVGKGDRVERLEPDGWRSTSWGWGVNLFTALCFSRNGKTLVAGRADGTLYVWDLAGDRPPRKVYGHKEGVTDLALSPDGKALASASADSTVLVWDLAALRASGSR
jgi:RNA polymerase sigma factor (sigma-70 family)